MSVVIKLFIGAPISGELRMYLDASRSWKQESLFGDPNALIELRHLDKAYLGRYVAQEKMPLAQLKQQQQQLCDEILRHCPNMTASALKFVLFPQLFLT
jgi:hypothetical protein